MTKRIKWTPEKLTEISEWKKTNNATVTEAAANFKVSPKKLASALTRHKKTAPRKQKFIDLVAPAASGQVAVIICTPDQVAAIVRGLQ